MQILKQRGLSADADADANTRYISSLQQVIGLKAVQILSLHGSSVLLLALVLAATVP